MSRNLTCWEQNIRERKFAKFFSLYRNHFCLESIFVVVPIFSMWKEFFVSSKIYLKTFQSNLEKSFYTKVGKNDFLWWQKKKSVAPMLIHIVKSYNKLFFFYSFKVLYLANVKLFYINSKSINKNVKVISRSYSKQWKKFNFR